MYAGVASSEEIERYRSEGLNIVDAKHAKAAAETLREAILSGQLALFAIFSSRDTPIRLTNKALIEAALFPDSSAVLTFAYVDRHAQAPFFLSKSDLKELIRDPLCVEKRGFWSWVKKQEGKKSWPCHQNNSRRPRGRPSGLKARVVEIIEVCIRKESSLL